MIRRQTVLTESAEPWWQWHYLQFSNWALSKADDWYTCHVTSGRKSADRVQVVCVGKMFGMHRRTWLNSFSQRLHCWTEDLWEGDVCVYQRIAATLELALDLVSFLSGFIITLLTSALNCNKNDCVQWPQPPATSLLIRAGLHYGGEVHRSWKKGVFLNCDRLKMQLLTGGCLH
jgi:hypothetical protein